AMKRTINAIRIITLGGFMTRVDAIFQVFKMLIEEWGPGRVEMRGPHCYSVEDETAPSTDVNCDPVDSIAIRVFDADTTLLERRFALSKENYDIDDLSLGEWDYTHPAEDDA